MNNPKRKMKRIIKLLYRLLFPRTAVVILSVPISAGLLIYAFLIAGKDSPIAYVSYVLSAYSLTIVCICVVPWILKCSCRVRQNPFVSQYIEDIPLKCGCRSILLLSSICCMPDSMLLQEFIIIRPGLDLCQLIISVCPPCVSCW